MKMIEDKYLWKVLKCPFCDETAGLRPCGLFSVEQGASVMYLNTAFFSVILTYNKQNYIISINKQTKLYYI